MKELSGRASAILGRYRAVEALRETEKARLLEALQARVVRGDLPRDGVDVPPPLPAPRAHFLERVWSAPLAKTGIGVLGVAAAVAVIATRPKAAATRAFRPLSLADDPGTLNHARPEPLPTATLDEEARLLHDAELAVRTKNPRRALLLLDEHATKFPSGKLTDSREVTRMVALCDMGARSAAREKAEHFLVEHPDSPFSDRVRRICAASDP
jgi:hypothetical protein